MLTTHRNLTGDWTYDGFKSSPNLMWTCLRWLETWLWPDRPDTGHDDSVSEVGLSQIIGDVTWTCSEWLTAWPGLISDDSVFYLDLFQNVWKLEKMYSDLTLTCLKQFGLRLVWNNLRLDTLTSLESFGTWLGFGVKVLNITQGCIKHLTFQSI